MPNFERSSLNQKLTIISLLSTATALLFVFAAFVATSVANHRKDEAMQLQTFAQVIAASSADYLLLRDRARGYQQRETCDGVAAVSLRVVVHGWSVGEVVEYAGTSVAPVTGLTTRSSPSRSRLGISTQVNAVPTTMPPATTAARPR